MITQEERKTIITEIVQKGVTIQWWSYLIFAIIAFFASYLGGYLRRKGENVATKKDIARITDEIESVKHEYSKELYIHQVRYEKEFDILSDLSKKLIYLRDAALSLRPVADFKPPDVKEEEWKKTN